MLKETAPGVALGFSVGTAAAFLCLTIPPGFVAAPALQLASTLIGGTAGFIYGIHQAKAKWHQCAEEERITGMQNPLR